MRKIVLILSLSLFSFNSYSIEGVYKVIIEKQKAKESTRWSLANWLSTKKKISLMDQWLALNTDKTLFESKVSAQKITVEKNSGDGSAVVEHDQERFSIDFYVSLFGIHYEKVQGYEDGYAFDGRLRLLGASLQGTNLIAFYGVRKHNESTYGEIKQSYFGGEINMYLLPFLGVNTRYKKFEDAKFENNNFTMAGERVTFGAFLEYSFVRIEAMTFKENAPITTNTGSKIGTTKEGLELSLSLYF